MRSRNKHNRVINWSHSILAYIITKLIHRAKLVLGHKVVGIYVHIIEISVFFCFIEKELELKLK